MAETQHQIGRSESKNGLRQFPIGPLGSASTSARGRLWWVAWSQRNQKLRLTVVLVDFADFAGAPSPSPVSIPTSPAGSLPSQPTDGSSSPVPYTKWYRVWERTKPSDFYTEAILLPFLILAVVVHLWGTTSNKRRAKKWMAVHMPVLDSEFSLVGYIDRPKRPEIDKIQADFKTSVVLSGENLPADMLKEKTAAEFQTYATGRQNTAFVDFKLQLYKRYNPVIMAGEYIAALFFDSFTSPVEKMEAVAYAFDGKEKDFVPPGVPGSDELSKLRSTGSSAYDGFVFAVVNKMSMRKLRDERYDISLTYTKDHPKLPNWVTVMSESAEVTDAMLTKELIAAIEQAGDAINYLILSDQAVDKPTTLNETIPKKRIHLSLKLPANGDYSSTLPLFQAFLRLPDHLAQSAHFRPEVKRKITTTREAEIKKLKKVSDEEVEEQRRTLSEKVKKDERDRKLKGMSADEQRKFLEKEAERERKKQEKKMSRKG